MPRPTLPTVDPVFTEIAKAIYGDVDVRELLEVAKSAPDGSAVHVDGPVGPTQRQLKDQRRLAATGLAATGVAGVAGVHAIKATLNENADRMAEATGIPKKIRPVGAFTRLADKAHIKPARAAAIIGAGALGLHGVELVGDTLGAHAQLKALKAAQPANPDKTVSKAFRLKPLNTISGRVPSLRARRVKMSPQPSNPTTQAGLFKALKIPRVKPVKPFLDDPKPWSRKVHDITYKTAQDSPRMRSPQWYAEALGLPKPVAKSVRSTVKGVGSTIRNVKAVTGHTDAAAGYAEDTARNVADATEKVKHLIPTPREAGVVAGSHLAVLGGAGAAGSYVAGRKHKKLVPVVPVSKGVRAAATGVGDIFRNVESSSGHAVAGVAEAERSARNVAESTEKIKNLIPSKKTAGVVAGAHLTALGGGLFAAGYGNRRRKDKKLVPVTTAPVAKSVEVVWTGEIAKVDAEQRQVFGWASVSAINGQEVVDLQGDIVPIEETEKAAYQYVLESRKGGDMHRRVAKYAEPFDMPLHTADMIESFVVTPEKLEKMGLPLDALPHGWWVGYHVNDEDQWNMVKSGERTGFSIHGKGTRKSVSKADDQPRHERVRAGLRLAERAEQARHPPQVKMHPVTSAAIRSMGYQPQTRRLAYEMNSKPGKQYTAHMGGEQAVDAMLAPSRGRYFATQIRGKTQQPDGYSLGDRARLFANPQRGDQS